MMVKSTIISKTVAGISPSATTSTSFLANQLRRQGIDIISFAMGEPDFDTPEHIKEAAIKALQEVLPNIPMCSEFQGSGK